jgi:hypothetical protein
MACHSEEEQVIWERVANSEKGWQRIENFQSAESFIHHQHYSFIHLGTSV